MQDSQPVLYISLTLCPADVRTLVAHNFYGVICDNYFFDSPASERVLGRSKATTLTAVFQLLSDSVVGHPENQSKLRRSTSLGGHRIGNTLTRLQDFLPLEALLELFANLLPSAKAAGGQEKRAQFVRQVFNPTYFPNYQEIAEILTSPVLDWTITSQRISDSLAVGKPLFPQPFETKQIVIGSSQTYPVERIYVDGSGFLASVDEGDTLSTLQLPYRQLEKLSVSRPSKGVVVVIVVSKVPPIKNQEILPAPLSQEEGRCQCSWELKANDAERMFYALRHRKLDHLLTAASRKISLSSGGVEFLDTRPPVPSQIKAKEISSLWSKVDPHETSPLLPKSATSHVGAAVTPRYATSKLGYKDTPSASIAPGESGLQPSKVPVPVAALNDRGPLPELTDLDSEPENSPSQIVRRVTRKNKRAFVIKSDTEPESLAKRPLESEADKNQPKTMISPLSKPFFAQTPARKKGKENTKVQTARQTRATTRALAATTAFQSPSDRNSRKHKLEEEVYDENQIKKANRSNAPPAKRPRLKEETAENAPFSPMKEQPKRPKPRPVRNYRTKRGSSPPASARTSAGVDQDKPQATSRTAATRMKDGKNKTVKPRPAKPPPTVKEERRPKLRDIISISSDGECQKQKQSVRRSPRINKAAIQTAQLNSKGLREDPKQLGQESRVQQKPPKPKRNKAPWDSPSLTAQVELSKSDMATSSMQLSELMDPPALGFDVQMWNANSSKPVSRMPTPVEKCQEDVEMVDLTKDGPSPEVNQAKSLMPVILPERPARRLSATRVDQEAIGVPSRTSHSLIDTVPQARPTMRAVKVVQTKTMVDIGIQVDTVEEISVTPQPLVSQNPSPVAPAPEPSVKSLPKVQTLTVARRRNSFAFVTSTPVPKPKLDGTPSLITKPPMIPRMRQRPVFAAEPSESVRSVRRRVPERVTRSIGDVLSEINDAILSKIESKFDGVRGDLRAAQKRLLDTTAERLGEMQSKNIEQYNVLVELFEKYATERRGNLQLFDEIRRANQEAVDGVAEILLKLSRQSLSKKFPKSLFASSLGILKERKSLYQ